MSNTRLNYSMYNCCLRYYVFISFKRQVKIKVDPQKVIAKGKPLIFAKF